MSQNAIVTNPTVNSLDTIRPNIDLPALSKDENAALREVENLLFKFTGIKLKPEPEVAINRFALLPPENRKSVVAGWNSQSDFLRAALSEDLTAFDESRMLQFAFGKLGLLGVGGLSGELSSEDIVEICGLDHVQIYRSYSYFSLTNYSLLELSAYPWYELYERSPMVTQALVGKAETILSSGASSIDLTDIPEYTIRETMSSEQAVFLVQEKKGYKLRSAIDGKIYLMSTKSVREVESKEDSNKKVFFI